MKKLRSKILPKAYGLFFNLYVHINPKRTAKKAFYVFCKVRKGRVKPDQKEFLEPARNQQYQIAGHTIQAYEWKGVKDTVLLVHGWESNSWRWHKLIAKLREANYRIIAFDAPAHGYSSGKYLYVPLYAKIVQFMIETYQPKSLIGHSVGGMTLMYNEHKNPSPFTEKMVTIGSPSEFHEIIFHYRDLLGLNKRVYSALETFIVEKLGFTIREFSTSDFARSNTKKGLLFHDRSDKIAPYHASEQVHANWKGSKFISTQGLGHSMHQDEINDEIITFLGS
ncbi:alpha/beta fold hydrolase [Maribacter sp. 2304DJ31-5]|uniref:alpha/beta fold hydrolase n=1 Tax=Maribacter sp. 2304DJ31-5 TaxID=3386273 RepID=UPI0039BCBFF2